MAEIKVVIPDTKKSQALDSIANQTSWDPTSGISKDENASTWLYDQVKRVVRLDLLNREHDTGVALVDEEMRTW